jgi:hypothetical protein
MFDPKHHESKANKYLRYFSLLMTLVYPALGIYLIISSPEQIHLDPTMKKILGGVLVVYGIYRFYRAYLAIFKNPNE